MAPIAMIHAITPQRMMNPPAIARFSFHRFLALRMVYGVYAFVHRTGVSIRFECLHGGHGEHGAIH
jgi:hypothetical protein